MEDLWTISKLKKASNIKFFSDMLQSHRFIGKIVKIIWQKHIHHLD